MLLFSRMLNRWVEARRLLATSRDQVVDSLWRQVPGVVEQIYRDLGAEPGQRWGDKYPHYADGDLDPEALQTIDRLFPESQYVHIIRDPRAVVASILAKGWLGFDEAIEAWRVFVSHGRDFGTSLGDGRYHELRYEGLIQDAVATVEGVFSFLGLPASEHVDEFLFGEENGTDRSQLSHRQAWSRRTACVGGQVGRGSSGSDRGTPGRDDGRVRILRSVNGA